MALEAQANRLLKSARNRPALAGMPPPKKRDDSERSGSCTDTDRRPTRTPKRLSHRRITRILSTDVSSRPIASNSPAANLSNARGGAASARSSPYEVPRPLSRPGSGLAANHREYSSPNVDSDGRTESPSTPRPGGSRPDTSPTVQLSSLSISKDAPLADPTKTATRAQPAAIVIPTTTSSSPRTRAQRQPMSAISSMVTPIWSPLTPERGEGHTLRVPAPRHTLGGPGEIRHQRIQDLSASMQPTPQENQSPVAPPSPSDVLWDRGEEHRVAGRYDEACVELDAACRAYHREGNWLGTAKSLWSLGRVYRKRGQYKEAYSTLQKASRVYEDFGDRCGVAVCLRSLGDVLRGQGHYEKACSTLMEAWRVYQELGNGLGMADSLRSIAHVHQKQGNHHGAETVLKVACQSYRKEGDQPSAASCLLSLGDVLRRQGLYEDAHSTLQEAFGLYSRLGNQRGMGDCLKGTADVYRSQGRIDEAQQLLLKVFQTGIENH
ncbi:hypothetical protein FRB94_012337 [Tulasnella sp. JGI-2019a]|nr:hypothetical protein FRB93_000747 [Tulasnella sp. JGI-2019a]KAG9009268.1 hypothetical protein FRB94_012337 [Tulasnella sp. JGI-2019a]KAG9033611.1 hypothetical protein FRB95_014599 [Tulasnella sp. JGI-2019a]